MPRHDDTAVRQRVRAWSVWIFATLVLTTYSTAAFVSSRVPSAALELTPGHAVELTIFRLTGGSLSLSAALMLRHTSSPADVDPRHRRQPEVEVQVSSLGALTSVHRLGAMYAWSSGSSYHGLGPTGESLPLRPGLNRIRLDVQAVDPAFLGGTATVFVHAPLTFKSAEAGVYANLWWALLLWPAFLAVQTVWALVLLRRGVGLIFVLASGGAVIVATGAMLGNPSMMAAPMLTGAAALTIGAGAIWQRMRASRGSPRP
jgi:hypothetical protein